MSSRTLIGFTLYDYNLRDAVFVFRSVYRERLRWTLIITRQKLFYRCDAVYYEKWIPRLLSNVGIYRPACASHN